MLMTVIFGSLFIMEVYRIVWWVLSIKHLTTSNKFLNPSLAFVGTKERVKLNGDCFKQEKVVFNHGKIVNIYLVYEIKKSKNTISYPTLENCLFGEVKLKNMLMLISLNIQDMASDLTEKDLIQLIMKLVEM